MGRTWVAVGFVVALLAGCGDDDGTPRDFDAGLPCSAFSQIPCATSGGKCAVILDDLESGNGELRCTADGTQNIGEACTEPQTVGTADDCTAGGYCYNGTCRAICQPANDLCPDGPCVYLRDNFQVPLPMEVCLPTCDPFAQDCAKANEACILGSQPFCYVAGPQLVGEMCDSGCAPGLTCVFSTMGGTFCRKICGPWPDCFDADGGVTSCGCGATVTCGPNEICLPVAQTYVPALDVTGGVLDEIAGVCIDEVEAGCDCAASPICPSM